MSMEALGRLFNYRHLADGGYVNMRDANGVAFLCYLAGAAGDTYTLQEAKTAAGGSAQNLAVITRFYTCTGDGSDAWVLRTQNAAATMVTAAAATQNSACLHVLPEQLSDGFKYLKLTSTGAGLVLAMQYDLEVQRTPPNLPAVAL
jgi:hypothetical protein